MSTGNRCGIYDKIDALDEARTVSDLVSRLKLILSELAYYSVTGEGAVMETHEEWHGDFADCLYAEASADRTDALSAPACRRQPFSGEKAAKPKQSKRPPASDEKAAKPLAANSRNPYPIAPPSNRPRPSDLPPSLRQILEGTHASLREDDNF